MTKPTNAVWPMANYWSAWKTFRQISNEPSATVAHILRQPRWPQKDNLVEVDGTRKFRMLDLGCGDGRMIADFLIQSEQPIHKVVLLDPAAELLNEAEKQVAELHLCDEIESYIGVVEKEGLQLATRTDVGLAIHIAYLINSNIFRTFLENWPTNVPLYLVLDSPKSVFTELWNITSADFAARSAAVHKLLLSSKTLSAQQTSFETEIKNPFGLPSAVRDLVMSLLCYSDFTTLSANDRRTVEAIINRHTIDGNLRCECSCYEIFKEDQED